VNAGLLFLGLSDMSEVTVHALFPTPVCVFEYKPTDALGKYLKTQVTVSDQPIEIKKAFGTYSKNIKVLRQPECAELRKFILSKCKLFGNTVMGYAVNEYIDTISWVSIKTPGDSHTPHIHPNSLISGVYYFDENLKECPITFADPGSTVNKNATISVLRNKNSESTFASDHVTLDVRLGELVLFPSYLKHMVETNQTTQNRYSLAFNIMPRYSVGIDGDLTLFEYGDAL
jgi:uncharacterized protein (TIGR02466 family)